MLQLKIETTSRVSLGDPSNPLGTHGLYDADSALPINDATVQLLALVDEITGANVTGITLPITLSYLTDSNGVYKGKIPATANLVEGRFYELKVRATTAGGDQRVFYSSVAAVK